MAVHVRSSRRIRLVKGHVMVALARSPRPPHAEASSFETDVVAGLGATPKRIQAKYFYDGAGSQLFERITEQPEYYPTRSEMQILQRAGRRHRQAHSGRRGAGRVRQRFEQEGAHPVEGGAEARRLCAGRYLRRDDRAGSHRPAAGFPRPQGAAGDRRHHQAVRAAGRSEGRAGARRLLSRFDHRQFRAARSGGVSAQCRRRFSARAR